MKSLLVWKLNRFSKTLEFDERSSLITKVQIYTSYECAQEDFRISFSSKVLDVAIACLEKPFVQLLQHHSNFGFLYKFYNLSKLEIRKCSIKFGKCSY